MFNVIGVLASPITSLLEVMAGPLGITGALVVAALLVRGLTFPLAYRQARAVVALARVRPAVLAIEEDETLSEAEAQDRLEAVYADAKVGPFSPAIAGASQALIVSFVIVASYQAGRDWGGIWAERVPSVPGGWWWIAVAAACALCAAVSGALRLAGRISAWSVVGLAAIPAGIVIAGAWMSLPIAVVSATTAVVSLAQALLWWPLVGRIPPELRDGAPRS